VRPLAPLSAANAASKSALSIISQPPAEVARQLTLIEFNIYRAIMPSELTSLVGAGPTFAGHNVVTSWLTTRLYILPGCVCGTGLDEGLQGRQVGPLATHYGPDRPVQPRRGLDHQHDSL